MMLEGKRAIVTGGSRGIGRAIVERFLREGARVCYVARSESPEHESFENLAGQHGGEVVFKKADVGNESEISEVVEGTGKEWGGIDVLVNNAGMTRDGLIFRMKAEDWDEVMRVNLSSAFYTSKIASRVMLKQRQGSIVNVTSIVGIIGNGGQANYCSAKAGMIGLTKSLAREVGSRNVRVNAVAPGFVDTEMTDRLTEQQRDSMVAQIPMGRVGTPDEIASVVLFLASDMASYMTGQVLPITGGMSM